MQEGAIGTVYPFQWNAKNKTEWTRLMQTTNTLGGRIQLDESDKIRYSEVNTLINAEAGFIRSTREAQSGALGTVLDDPLTPDVVEGGYRALGGCFRRNVPDGGAATGA